MRHISQPPVAAIRLHQTLRLPRHVARERLPEMHDFEFGQVAQMGQGERAAKRIFLFAQMADHGDAKAGRGRFTGCMDLS